MKKSGLGKGIEALFQESIEKSGEIVALDLSVIETNSNQPRSNFDENALNALANSIKENGVLQPIVVRPLDGGRYQIIAGERRFRASKLANLKDIPVIVREADLKNSTELALIENLQREDLNPIEEARGYLFLIEKYNLTQGEVAKKVGKSRSAIANLLRLLNLPEEIMREIESGNLSEGQARALLSVGNVDLMKNLANKAISSGMSVREIEKQAALFKKAKAKVLGEEKKDQAEGIYHDLEVSMKTELRRNVKIESKGEKGRLIIEFYTREELVDMAYSLANLRRY